MIFEEIKTQRLTLRKFTPETYGVLYKNLSDPELIEILGLSSTDELQNEKNKFEGGLRTHNRTFVFFQIIENASRQVIGWCGFHTWYLDHARAEVGYSLNDDSHKQKGYMSEALESILKYGFHEMKLNRVEAFVGPSNIPSLKLMDKFGFVKEGVLKSHYFKNGIMEDSIVFGLLKP